MASTVPSLFILLVWHAPLGVRSAKRRHQSPEWTILSHSYCLIQGEIVRPQVLLDSLHPCSSRMSWWSSAVLWRGSSYDTPGICLVWHSRDVAKQRKMPCLDNSRQAWLPDCLVDVPITADTSEVILDENEGRSWSFVSCFYFLNFLTILL